VENIATFETAIYAHRINMSSTRTIRIASRKSQLALVQTHWVRDELQKAFPDTTFEIITMSTQGDIILDVPLAKGLFTKELEVQMLDGKADFAVHSLKDLPTNLPAGLMLGCVTEREDPADALVVHATSNNINSKRYQQGQSLAPHRCDGWPNCVTTIRTWGSKMCAVISIPAWPNWIPANMMR
jgi:Porphobilinogen deaminase, dipyromethane cofactor binding domain